MLRLRVFLSLAVSLAVVFLVATTSQAGVFFEHVGDADPLAEGFTRGGNAGVNFANPASPGVPANWQLTQNVNYRDFTGATGDGALSDIDDVFSDPTGWTYTMTVKTNLATTPFVADIHLRDTSFSSAVGNRSFNLTMISASGGSPDLGLHYQDLNSTWVQIGTVDPTDGFHTYQIVLDPKGTPLADDNEALFYVDGNLEATVAITQLKSSGSITNYWGSGSIAASDSQWSHVRLETGQHPVAPVPEPSTMMLFGTALIGLLGCRRRQT
jgi:hypothetical protein